MDRTLFHFGRASRPVAVFLFVLLVLCAGAERRLFAVDGYGTDGHVVLEADVIHPDELSVRLLAWHVTWVPAPPSLVGVARLDVGDTAPPPRPRHVADVVSRAPPVPSSLAS